jgi:hypothetical protein
MHGSGGALILVRSRSQGELTATVVLLGEADGEEEKGSDAKKMCSGREAAGDPTDL